MAKVSIIIPAFNPGPYLRETLASVFRQSFQDWELLVVDDGSKEDLSWITRDFPRVRVIRQENSGVSVARNVGILQSTGEYLAFLDQDDLWLPSKLARQVAVLDSSPEIAMCYCDLEVFNEGNQPATGGPSTDRPLPAFVIELAESNPTEASLSRLHRSILHFSSRFVVPSTVMYRRSSLAVSGLLDPFLPFSGDYEMLIKVAAQNKVARIPAVEVLYRRHANNFSHRDDVCQAELKALAFKFRTFAIAKGDWPLARAASRLFRVPPQTRAAQAIDRCRASLRQRDRTGAFNHFLRAFYLSPKTALKSVLQWLAIRVRSYGSVTR